MIKVSSLSKVYQHLCWRGAQPAWAMGQLEVLMSKKKYNQDVT
jgi:hypothetical protein